MSRNWKAICWDLPSLFEAVRDSEHGDTRQLYTRGRTKNAQKEMRKRHVERLRRSSLVAM